MGSEMMEEHYDKLIQEFLSKLETTAVIADLEGTNTYFGLIEAIKLYREHFKNNGIYGDV